VPRSLSFVQLKKPCREFQQRQLTWPVPVFWMSSGVDRLLAVLRSQ